MITETRVSHCIRNLFTFLALLQVSDGSSVNSFFIVAFVEKL